MDWGEIDYLIIDTPPGTSDEHLSIVQYLGASHVDGAVIITTPQVTELKFPLIETSWQSLDLESVFNFRERMVQNLRELIDPVPTGGCFMS